jgi:hypothetical protein
VGFTIQLQSSVFIIFSFSAFQVVLSFVWKLVSAITMGSVIDADKKDGGKVNIDTVSAEHTFAIPR